MAGLDFLDSFTSGLDRVTGAASSLAAARDKLNTLKARPAQAQPVSMPLPVAVASPAIGKNTLMLGAAGVLLAVLLLMRRRG